jgi:hypothetical protein
MGPAHTSSRIAKAVLFAGALFVLTPCAPQPSAVFASTGTWRGSVTDESSGSGAFTLVLPQPGTDQIHRGTWSATFGSRSLGGSATAPAGMSPLTVRLGCTSAVLSTLTAAISGTRMTGQYTACDTLARGTVDLDRQ